MGKVPLDFFDFVASPVAHAASPWRPKTKTDITDELSGLEKDRQMRLEELNQRTTLRSAPWVFCPPWVAFLWGRGGFGFRQGATGLLLGVSPGIMFGGLARKPPPFTLPLSGFVWRLGRCGVPFPFD